MNKPLLSVLTTCALLSAASFAQDPGFIQKLDPQKHREVMPRHVQMLEEQKKQDAELAPLLEAMNAGDRRKARGCACRCRQQTH